ncbi:MAG: PaaI family thioesterase [Gammaproteobacteria bacterium]
MLKTIESLKASGNMAAINQLIPYAATVGLEAFMDEGGLVTVLRYRESNIGNFILRAVHGGVVGALLEHAAILHLLSETELKVLPKMINLSVDFLRPCLVGDTYARGRVIKQGRRIVNVRAEAWQENPERPVAAAHAHFLLSP